MDVPGLTYDGVPAPVLAERLGVARLALFDAVDSTLDVTHRLAEQRAPAGTLVLADTQRAGRGRQGRAWLSPPGAGVWLGWLVRPGGTEGTGVLALRAGLAVATALESLGIAARLKWPNDVILADRKLAGILCEARTGAAQWVAVGVGINIHGPLPDALVEGAVTLDEAVSGADRVGMLEALVPQLARMDPAAELSAAEVAAWDARDWLRGRELVEPIEGTASGIGADGSLRVRTSAGERVVRGGTVRTCS